ERTGASRILHIDGDRALTGRRADRSGETMIERVSRTSNCSRELLLLAAGWMTIAAPTAQSQSVPQWQTDAGGKMAFEVASIKPSKPGTFVPPNFPLDAGAAYARTGGRFSGDF